MCRMHGNRRVGAIRRFEGIGTLDRGGACLLILHIDQKIDRLQLSAGPAGTATVGKFLAKVIYDTANSNRFFRLFSLRSAG